MESGLYYNWNRYYDPDIGRYITYDPYGIITRTEHSSYFTDMSAQDMHGLNQPYVYANSNPLVLFDPFGLDPSCIYYGRRCQEDGGLYYCYTAPLLCTYWPQIEEDGVVSCVRKCLQKRDRQCDPTPLTCSPGSGIDTACNFIIHEECWDRCLTALSK